MDIKLGLHEERRHFSIELSRDDFNQLCLGDEVYGRRNDVEFLIYSLGNNFSDTWRDNPNGGYFFNVSVSAVRPKDANSSEDWDRVAQQTYDNLESAINNSGIKPMIMNNGYNCGYVTMKVRPLK
ncbi:MAG: hypothetical protein Q8Q35_03990 [Nanoarchaeota archaeon]|nr:hypothetical protein [Nanoarchaeota archaeon]